MAGSISIDGVDRTSVIPFDDVELSESAYLGEVGSGSLLVEDTTGLITVTGHKQIIVTESASSNSRIWTGYASGGPKSFVRGDTSISSNGRDFTVPIEDVNVLFGRRVFSGKDAKRPAETVNARIAWVLASDEVTGADSTGGVLFADYGRVASSTEEMDKTDYRGQTPGDVLGACAKAAEFNWYLRHNHIQDAIELVFRDDTTSTQDTTSASISNAAGEADDGTIFAPVDPTLEQDPADVYAGVYYTWARGAGYETKSSTASNFAWRDGVMEDSGIRKSATAARQARSFLRESDTEEQVATVTLELTPSQVNLFRTGQRTQVRLTHLTPEGWEPARWARILRRRISQPLQPEDHYRITLDLSPVPTPPDTCAFPETTSQVFYPLGGPVVPGSSVPNPTGGNVYYLRGGVTFPVTVQPGYTNMVWHFPTYGAGGPNTTDFFASGLGNELRFVLVGNGTLTINTARWQGQAQPYTIRVVRMEGGGAGIQKAFYTGTAGDSTAVVIETAVAPGLCLHTVALRADARINGTYIGMGWTGASWVSS